MPTTTSRDGTTISYESVGSGPPLVIVLGALNTGASGHDLAHHLLSYFTVFSYDRRGRGGSTDTPPWSRDKEVEDLAAVVAATAAGSALLYGHSSGAVLALESAAAGVPVGKVAGYEPPVTFSNGEGHNRLSPLAERMREALAGGGRKEALEMFWRDAVGLPPAAVEHMEHSAAFPTLLELAHTLPYDVELSAADDGFRSRMARVSVPALLVAGGESGLWARAAVETVADMLPRARVTTLEGQTHGVAPEVVAPLLVEFFLG